ncbi:F-box protein At1g70590-like isoform X1 [Zingiber officinale]|uniref:F-box protein At1g70590-like isoform X1 n=1 Tax=Zingiber officinale TaxID=94328 RepID=UPI001C4AD2D1|nr:F-box protein At1g70590-like isoform X1 [Zingiber officinale]
MASRSRSEMEKKRGRPTAAATPVHSHSRRKKSPRLLLSRNSFKASFADLPSDLLMRLAAPFDMPTLWAASMACQSWREALRPLREAMVLLRLGKRYKHGRGPGIARPNPRRALEYFLKGADRGSAAAMVDAGLMYWEMGRKGEAQALYNKAAELGHPVGQCNLGVCYLEADQPNPEEAVRWFYQAAQAGYARAEYNLALCLHKGRGLKINMENAAKWYLRAAEGGYVRAMYNTSLCYSTGEGLAQNLRRAREWMKRAAKAGHSKAQFEYGLQLYSSGDMVEALVYLELATRAGVDDATHTRDVIQQSLSQTSRARAHLRVENWRPS